MSHEDAISFHIGRTVVRSPSYRSGGPGVCRVAAGWPIPATSATPHVTIGAWSQRRPGAYGDGMSTQHLGYVGVGVLVAIVVVTLLGVPPEVWLSVALVAGVVGVIALVVVHQAKADGSDLAKRFVAGRNDPPTTQAPARTGAVDQAADVEVELVRVEDETSAAPAVWLHRRGGRRVHRFRTGTGWTVQRVSTKDPNNPRKRVIGERLAFATEGEAVAAANDLARGLDPKTAQVPVAVGNRLVAEAQA